MSQEERVVRLRLAESGASDTVRSVLEAARDVDPSHPELERLGARLAAALPPGTLPIVKPSVAPPAVGGTGAAGAGGVAATVGGKALVGWGVKGLAGLVLVAAVGGGAWRATQHETAPSSAHVAPPSVPTSPALVVSEVTVAAPPPSESASVGPRPPSEPSTSARPTSVHAATPANPASTEAEVLGRAHTELLHGAPQRALDLATQDAKAHPRGALAQERELIAIEALLRLGRTTEARARAEAFRKAYPGSSHLERLDALVGGP